MKIDIYVAWFTLDDFGGHSNFDDWAKARAFRSKSAAKKWLAKCEDAAFKEYGVTREEYENAADPDRFGFSIYERVALQELEIKGLRYPATM